MTENYMNGLTFGLAYARNHGLSALVLATRKPERFIDRPGYFAGVVDAALKLVQVRIMVSA